MNDRRSKGRRQRSNRDHVTTQDGKKLKKAQKSHSNESELDSRRVQKTVKEWNRWSSFVGDADPILSLVWRAGQFTDGWNKWSIGRFYEVAS